MTHADQLTRPEQYAERVQAKRIRARMQADRRQHGACVICKFRDETFGIFHCKGWPDRRMGLCTDDTKLPKFEFDDTTMGRYR